MGSGFSKKKIHQSLKQGNHKRITISTPTATRIHLPPSSVHRLIIQIKQTHWLLSLYIYHSQILNQIENPKLPFMTESKQLLKTALFVIIHRWQPIELSDSDKDPRLQQAPTLDFDIYETRSLKADYILFLLRYVLP